MRGFVMVHLGLPAQVQLESFVPNNHPLREIRKLALSALDGLHGRFSELYSDIGRPSIPPERMFLALLLQVFYGIRSELQLMEQLRYNMLFKWFVGLEIEEKVWNATTFTKNRERLFHGDLMEDFMQSLLDLKEVKRLLSKDHFSVDGTLIEAWASHKSFQPKDANSDDDGSDFHGQKRSNNTHASKTDPDARLYKKASGKEAKLSYMGNVMIENRHGLVVDVALHHASGTAERDAAKEMLERIRKRVGKGRKITVGADKLYDTKGFVKSCRDLGVTPHVAQNDKRKGGSAIDGRTTRHGGYDISSKRRKMVECPFGYGKQHGTLRKTKHRGIPAVASDFILNVIGYNLVRLPKIIASVTTQLPVPAPQTG